MRAAALLLPAALLLGSLGCFEAQTTVVLEADGSGSIASSLAMLPSTVKLARKMDKVFDQAAFAELWGKWPAGPEVDAEALAARGLTDVRATGTAKGTKLAYTVSAAFDRPASLEALSTVGGDDAPYPHVQLVPEADDTWRLVVAVDPGDVGMDGPDEAPQDDVEGDADEGDADAAPSKGGKNDLKKVFQLMGKLMEEATKARMEVSVTVPGEVLSAAPEVGLQVRGRTVTWRIDADALGGLASPEELDEMLPEDGFLVRFRPDGPLPAGVASP